MAKGPKVTFELDKMTPGASIQSTFLGGEKKEVIPVEAQSCSDFADLGDGQYAFLCDFNKITFLTYDQINGDISQKTVLELDSTGAGYNCSSIGTSSSKSSVYVLCFATDAESEFPKLSIITAEPTLPSIKQTFNLTQTQEQNLKNTSSLTVINLKVGDVSSDVLYAYEPSEAGNVRLFQFTADQDGAVSGGTYFVAGTNITSVDAEAKLILIRQIEDQTIMF